MCSPSSPSSSPSSSLPFVTPIADGTAVDVFVQPRAAKDGVVGIHGAALKLKVTALPAHGRANKAVEELLAAALKVPRSRVSVVSGHRSRSKRVAVAGLGADAVSCELAHVLSSRAHESGEEGR